MSQQIDVVKRYVVHIEKMEMPEAELLHPDYLQWELPNLLNKAGQKSDLADSRRRMGIARTIMAAQKFEIGSLTEEKNRVVMEAAWTGTMAVDAGPLKKGQELKAHFCMVFEFQDGKIHRVRNYDCFESF